MPDWIEPGVNIVAGALALVLLVRDRDKGVLRRICESKGPVLGLAQEHREVERVRRSASQPAGDL